MTEFSLTTFSSKGKREFRCSKTNLIIGKLLQIEYALNAVSKGETAIGLKAKNGVVLAVEKQSTNPLIDESSYRKIQNIAGHVGAVYAGLGPDYRVLLQKARKHAQIYDLKYRDPVLVSSLCRETAQIVQEYTQSGNILPQVILQPQH